MTIILEGIVYLSLSQRYVTNLITGERERILTIIIIIMKWKKKQKIVLLELRSGADAIQSFKCIVLSNVGALYQ